MKTCTYCALTLDESAFPKVNVKGKVRLRARCSSCLKKLKAEYNASDLGKKATQDYRNRTKEKTAVRVSKWQRDNKKRISELNLIRKYGVDLEWFDTQYIKQSGKCSVCKRIIDCVPSKETHVDHCHKTGVVRGILCHNCNVGLGLFSDSPDILRCAAEYIESSYV